MARRGGGTCPRGRTADLPIRRGDVADHGSRERRNPAATCNLTSVMSNSFDQDENLRTSVLDRLLDDNPRGSHESPQTMAQQMREIRQSVQRDLENLLNTRWRCTAWAPDLDELDDSLINYGIPDFCGA